MLSHIKDTAPVLLARAGYSVFPCLAGSKRPAVDRWEQRATADPDRVARYWPSPRHNVGVACGPSRLVVIDLDCHGELPADWQAIPGCTDGRDVLALLLEWAGQPWPVTYWVQTPSGGWHLYFGAPEDSRIRNSASLLGPQVDVRAQGGYVVGAGSVIGGRRYELIDGSEPAPLPGWLERVLTRSPETAPARTAPAADPPRRLRGLINTVRNSKPGDRTGPLVWAAHRAAEMIADGQADETAADQLVQAAVDSGIDGGEPYARRQVQHVLGGSR